MTASKGVRLRIDEFDRLTSERGWRTDAERARRLNVSHPTLSGIRNGHRGIGTGFIDRCLAEFGGSAYHVLFYREDS